MRVLFLDDMKERWLHFQEIVQNLLARGELTKVPTLDWASNADMAIEKLSTRLYDVVFLDHDLEQTHYMGNMDDPTSRDGRMVAHFIMDQRRTMGDIRHIHIHSWNHHGALEMEQIFRDGDGWGVSSAMFPKDIEDVLVGMAAILKEEVKH